MKIKEIAIILAGVGALNWGLVQLKMNVVEMLTTAINMPQAAVWIYYAVGVAGLLVLADALGIYKVD